MRAARAAACAPTRARPQEAERERELKREKQRQALTWIAFMKCARRSEASGGPRRLVCRSPLRGAQGPKGARSVLMEVGKKGQTTHHVYLAAAELESHANNDVETAKKLLQRGTQLCCAAAFCCQRADRPLSALACTHSRRLPEVQGRARVRGVLSGLPRGAQRPQQCAAPRALPPCRPPAASHLRARSDMRLVFEQVFSSMRPSVSCPPAGFTAAARPRAHAPCVCHMCAGLPRRVGPLCQVRARPRRSGGLHRILPAGAVRPTARAGGDAQGGGQTARGVR